MEFRVYYLPTLLMSSLVSKSPFICAGKPAHPVGVAKLRGRPVVELRIRAPPHLHHQLHREAGPRAAPRRPHGQVHPHVVVHVRGVPHAREEQPGPRRSRPLPEARESVHGQGDLARQRERAPPAEEGRPHGRVGRAPESRPTREAGRRRPARQGGVR